MFDVQSSMFNSGSLALRITPIAQIVLVLLLAFVLVAAAKPVFHFLTLSPRVQGRDGYPHVLTAFPKSVFISPSLR